MQTNQLVHRYQQNQLAELFETYVKKGDVVSVTPAGTVEIINGTTWKWLAKFLNNYNSIGFQEAIQLIIEGMKVNKELDAALHETADLLLLELIKKQMTPESFIKRLYAVHACVSLEFGVPMQIRRNGTDTIDNLLVVTVNKVTGDATSLLEDPRINAAIRSVGKHL